MATVHSLSHTKWNCRYHMVWRPKYRKKRLFWELREELGPVLRKLARHRGGEILKGRLRPDHAPILISIPKFAVPQVVGYIKGKSALYMAQNYLGQRRNFKGQHFWARVYYVSAIDKRRRLFESTFISKRAKMAALIN